MRKTRRRKERRSGIASARGLGASATLIATVHFRFRPGFSIASAAMMNALRLLICAGFLISPAARAQFEPTPNVILPNYDRVLIGETAALEAGAFVARVQDSSSTWYNPAGLAAAERTSINASSSAYQWTSVNAQGAGGETIGQANGNAVPGFFGIVIGAPLVSGDRFRIGISLARELDWGAKLQEQVSSSQSGSTERLSYSINNSIATVLPGVSLAYKVNDTFRVGLGVALASTSYFGSGSISNQQLGASSQSNLVDTNQVDANMMGLLFSVGAQYDLSEHWRIGLLVRSPSVRLWGSGQVNYDYLTSSGGQTIDRNFYDGSATFRYDIPLESFLGFAYVSRKFEIEGDLRYHAGIGPYAIISSTQPVVTNTSTGGAPTSNTSQSFTDIENSFRNVTDYAVGAKYNLTEHVQLHAGFYTSYSPVKESANLIFRKLDLYGGTLGASVTVGYFSGSVGAAYESGTSDSFGLPNLITGVPDPAKVRVDSVKLLYALTFAF